MATNEERIAALERALVALAEELERVADYNDALIARLALSTGRGEELARPLDS